MAYHVLNALQNGLNQLLLCMSYGYYCKSRVEPYSGTVPGRPDAQKHL